MIDTPFGSDFYDREYFNDGTISNYAPYGPGEWADWLADMVMEKLNPKTVLDVGCAYGFMVQRYHRAGIEAYGFDISEYAFEQNVVALWCWVGDAGDPAAYHVDVDLITATELPEHLTPAQSRDFLVNARQHAQRALLLTAIDDGTEHHDKSHINLQTINWWESEARNAGWQVADSSDFNADERALKMQWDGRFILLERP